MSVPKGSHALHQSLINCWCFHHLGVMLNYFWFHQSRFSCLHDACKCCMWNSTGELLVAGCVLQSCMIFTSKLFGRSRSILLSFLPFAIVIYKMISVAEFKTFGCKSLFFSTGPKILLWCRSVSWVRDGFVLQLRELHDTCCWAAHLARVTLTLQTKRHSKKYGA